MELSNGNPLIGLTLDQIIDERTPWDELSYEEYQDYLLTDNYEEDRNECKRGFYIKKLIGDFKRFSSAHASLRFYRYSLYDDFYKDKCYGKMNDHLSFIKRELEETKLRGFKSDKKREENVCKIQKEVTEIEQQIAAGDEHIIKQCEDFSNKLRQGLLGIEWLKFQDSYKAAYELFGRKECSWLTHVMFPPGGSFLSEEEEIEIRFLDVVVNSVLVRLNSVDAKLRYQPTQKVKGLARKLHMALMESGYPGDRVFANSLVRLQEEKLHTRVAVQPNSNVVRKEVVRKAGEYLKHYFRPKKAIKGRPFPDVVVKIVNVSGFDIEARQANRYLSEFDDPVLSPVVADKQP